MKKLNAQFSIGQIIHHKLFGYRGVIADVDASYQGSEQWYDSMALAKPSKEKPWYHILVDGTSHMTYVAEKNLEIDNNINPISHPELNYFFTEYHDGKYVPRQIIN